MIYLNLNETKAIAVTGLYNRATIATASKPMYTWQLQDCDSGLTFSFANEDNSSAYWNYSLFTFSQITSATYGATAGIISAPQGVYNYQIYQSYTQSLSFNKLIKTGIFVIVASFSTPNVFNNTATTITFKN